MTILFKEAPSTEKSESNEQPLTVRLLWPPTGEPKGRPRRKSVPGDPRVAWEVVLSPLLAFTQSWAVRLAILFFVAVAAAGLISIAAFH